MSSSAETLQEIYQKLFDHFGPQHWWPGDTPFEICVGAILTQNTAWSNVEKAIANLKNAGLLDFEKMFNAPVGQIAELIRPAGYFNIKAKRLRKFLEAIKENYGSFDGLVGATGRSPVREFLLSIKGIGPETADSMALYAFGEPTFVVDAYTKRVLVRHNLIEEEADYYQIKEFCEAHLERDVQLFNEFHALIVRVGKEFCKKTNPKCEECPLRALLVKREA